ncbi:hypothetical protein Tsubulata_030254 [Turnera subulata]|uniref:DUF4283 domain-containing protein n=1 Tax=Turnera subulata TaxID=218843 RepID=A0A9Q0G917_9ROSI|nr:hypothetical protein Tsubulata_030254 [Turnera subulata]
MRWNHTDILLVLGRYGDVMDVFIPHKASKSGVRIGFLCFRNDLDVNHLVENINKVSVDDGFLRSNVARNRNGSHPNIARLAPTLSRQNGAVDKCFVNERQSFSQVAGSSSSVPHGASDGGLQFTSKGVTKDLLRSCAFGVLKEPMAPDDVLELFHVNQVSLEISVKPMGGKAVLVFFRRYEELMSVVHANWTWIKESFDIFRPWSNGDSASNRMCWINVYGIPPHAWCNKFFDLISIHFGLCVKPEKPLLEASNIDVARIQILTTLKEPIYKKFQVSVNGKAFDIVIVESQPCAFCCKTVSNSSVVPASSVVFSDKFKELQSVGRCKEVSRSTSNGEANLSDPFGILKVINAVNKGSSSGHAIREVIGGKNLEKSKSLEAECTPVASRISLSAEKVGEVSACAQFPNSGFDKQNGVSSVLGSSNSAKSCGPSMPFSQSPSVELGSYSGDGPIEVSNYISPSVNNSAHSGTIPTNEHVGSNGTLEKVVVQREAFLNSVSREREELVVSRTLDNQFWQVLEKRMSKAFKVAMGKRRRKTKNLAKKGSLLSIPSVERSIGDEEGAPLITTKPEIAGKG